MPEYLKRILKSYRLEVNKSLTGGTYSAKLVQAIFTCNFEMTDRPTARQSWINSNKNVSQCTTMLGDQEKIYHHQLFQDSHNLLQKGNFFGTLISYIFSFQLAAQPKVLEYKLMWGCGDQGILGSSTYAQGQSQEFFNTGFLRRRDSCSELGMKDFLDLGFVNNSKIYLFPA